MHKWFSWAKEVTYSEAVHKPHFSDCPLAFQIKKLIHMKTSSSLTHVFMYKDLSCVTNHSLMFPFVSCSIRIRGSHHLLFSVNWQNLTLFPIIGGSVTKPCHHLPEIAECTIDSNTATYSQHTRQELMFSVTQSCSDLLY